MATAAPVNDQPCPVARSVDLIGDRWSLLIVRDAFDGMRRFSDFQRSLGVARNILSDRLKKLVDAGVLETEAAAEGSAYQAYVLTPRGQSLLPVVLALRQWGESNLFKPGEAHSLLLDKATGQPVPPLRVLDAQGHELRPAQTWVRKLDAGDEA